MYLMCASNQRCACNHREQVVRINKFVHGRFILNIAHYYSALTQLKMKYITI